MTAKVKTKDVDKSSYDNFLKKAEELFGAAEDCFKQSKFNSAAVTAIHAGISLVDSWCAYSLGKRFAGEKHEDVVNLIKIIPNAKRDDIDKVCQRILTVLKMKNMAEYEERLVKQKEAEKAISQVGKISEIVKSYLPRQDV